MGRGGRLPVLITGFLTAAASLSLPAQAAGGGGCANADIPSDAASLDVMRTAVVCLINEQRTNRGLPTLSASPKLDRAAQGWTTAMVDHEEFAHANFTARIDAVHYDWQVAGENIATGYISPREVVDAWMASPDHCRNILDPSFRNVGTGERSEPVSGWATGPATWTQDFGLTMDQSPPSRNFGPASHCPYP